MSGRRPAALGRAASALAIGGVLVAAGARAEPAPAAAAPAPAGGGACAHDAALEAAVTRALKKKVRDIEPTPGARIEISFGCPAVPGPRQATALFAHGHGGFSSVLDVGGGEVRALRLQPASRAALAGPPPPVARATARPPADAVARALAFANVALASSIRVELPPPVPGAAQTIAARATSHDEALEIQLAGTGKQPSSWTWSGYVDSTHAGVRVPLEVAWDALWALAGDRLRPGPPDEADRAAYQRVMDRDGARPGFANDGLLELGAVLATGPAVRSLTPFLASPSERTRILAVNALATATGKDLRRDATGAVRPLADVAAAYRALLAAPPPARD